MIRSGEQIPFEPNRSMNEQCPVEVWDVANKKKIYDFPSISDCARFLDVHTTQVSYTLKYKSRMRASTTRLGIVITLRKAKK